MWKIVTVLRNLNFITSIVATKIRWVEVKETIIQKNNLSCKRWKMRKMF